MSQSLELADPVFSALLDVAREDGTSPQGWIAARLAETKAAHRVADVSTPQPSTLADLFAGRVGRIASGGRERLSELGGAALADELERKRGDGCL